MAGKAGNYSLRTILFADLVDYSRFVSQNEAPVLDFMERAFVEFAEQAEEFGGSLVKTTGDGAVVEFASASQAVRYAVALQARFADLRQQTGLDGQFRIGIHAGEIQRTDTDIYGHAVNIAARLESQAKPGGILISHEVYQNVWRSTPFGFVSEGVKPLKNIPESIATYHVVAEGEDAASHMETEGLAVSTIDGLSVAGTGGESAVVRSDRVRALLGYLALRPGLSETSERIAALLWPDKDSAAARRSLGSCFRTAKNVLDQVSPGVLYRQDEKIGLDEARTDVDLISLLSNISIGAIDETLIETPDWPETILYGQESVSTLFRSWLRVTRHNWRTRFIEGLETSLLRHEAPEVAARRAATALLVIEPSHEKALQKLVQHHAASGNLALAIKTYQEFARLLDEQYQIEPSAETTALIESLKAKTTVDVPEPVAEPRLTRLPRIVVGDFDADRADPTDIHLVAGFRSEVVANLSRFRDWVVVEANGVTDGGDQPGSDYTITAQCDKGHTELIISVVLKDSATNRIVWSDRFEVSIENWFESQRRLVRRVAAHTEIYLSSDRLARIVGIDDMNKSDYNDWLKGEHLLSLWAPQYEDKAEATFSTIIDRSPEFAPAHASLASIYNVRHLIRPGTKRDAQEDMRALPLALRAVELDALDSRNQQVIAWSAAMAERFEQAAVHYELATNLNGSSPKALISCAQGLAFVGAADRAGALLEEAFELAPFFLPYQWCYAASTYYMIGNYEAAADAAMRGGHATMDNPGWRAASLARLDRITEAKAAFMEQVELVRGDWAGGEPANAEGVRDWFLQSFPIGRAEDRAGLADALGAAAG